MERQMTFADIDGDYKTFVDKFKPKKTTDDCYTPPNIYDAVKAWAVREYGLEGREIVRPFWPGAEFDAIDYPPNCVVLDNPPFSIISKIIDFYLLRKIDYFLFAPAMKTPRAGNAVVIAENIIYENGADVPTGFVTNLGEWRVQTACDLSAEIKRLNTLNTKKEKKTVRKIALPDEVLTMAQVRYLCAYGVDFAVCAAETFYQHDLDNYNVFGGCLILSERAAAERVALRAAAERAAAREVINLSEREKAIVRALSERSEHETP